MRAFLAMELNEYVKDNIQKTQNLLSDTNAADLKNVEYENIHMTVKFFGDINERKTKQITKIINNTTCDYKPYTMKVSKIGAFPNTRKARVIWTKAGDKNNTTIDLIQNLDEQFSKIGFNKEHSYKPHITLSRVKRIHDNELLQDTLDEIKNSYYGKVNVDRILLKSSTLTPEGPQYKTEKEFIL